MANEAETKRTDWEAIERDYRAGILSLREIAKRHGISDTAIRKKARANGWERDLTEKVNEQARSQLVRETVRTANPQTEQEIVNDAAATIVTVVRGHRKHISRQVEIVEALVEQLAGAAGNRDAIEDAIFDETADEENGKRRAAMLKAVSLPSHTSAMVNLTNALKTLIGLERQAFNIKDETQAPASNPLADLLAKVSGSALPVVKDDEAQ